MENQTGRVLKPQVLFPFLVSLFCLAVSDQIFYSVPEEMAKGSVVCNLAKDLGLEVRDLRSRKLRVSGEREYFTVSAESGELVIRERVDREQICGKKPVCALDFEAVAENPLNFFHITVEIEDINDHSPQFGQDAFDLQISESTLPGARFILVTAQDADVGINSLQKYHISPNADFSLVNKQNKDGNKYPELVLEKSLDRETQSSHQLFLTAVDGGDPARSSTAQIRIKVTDANDNAPVFSQDVYRVSLPENLPRGFSVLQVMATDKDELVYAEITFSFRSTGQDYLLHTGVFDLDVNSGEITTAESIDFEKNKDYSLVVEARDGGGLVTQCTVEIEVLDVNDNAPEIILQSIPSVIPEDVLPNTVIALIKTRDKDSGHNGEVSCKIKGNVPFKISSSSRNSYKLMTDGPLDREQIPEYNITVIAIDKGSPSLSTSKILTLVVGDVNDNPPVFLHLSYVVYVPENNPSGASIAGVSASDSDLEENAQVSYSIIGSGLAPVSRSSYVSVSGHNGDIFAQSSFDYEQIQTFEVILQACDSGSPVLCANVTLQVFVLDRNDNAPNILYPTLGPDNSALFDMVPRSAEPGYLVTKVVAVDSDSGHNAWLSYHLLQATDPGLFSLGLHTGEVRTTRALTEKDSTRHRLLVSVQDAGQPPLSVTVGLHLVFADSLQETLPEMKEEHSDILDPQYELQFYLVISLALVSVLFLVTVILAITLRLRKSSSPKVWGCLQPNLCSKSGPGLPTNYSDTLPYSYDLCVTMDQGKTAFKVPKCNGPLNPGQDLLSFDLSRPSYPLFGVNDSTSYPETLDMQAPPNTDWRFSQAQRPGTSGSQNGDEGGTWPNNQFDTEMLQAMILASANEAADGSSTLGGGAGTMGLSARYGPQFTLQHVPDYRQNVYIPGSTATLANAAGKRDGKATAGGNGNKKKSGKKEKK
ncbi:protocadherin gamma-B5-like isoform X7 [Trichosurus vulpecula]|uniref:protocadherin gamma-B5-like isoform X7 n=1 Tax=Trichosurus vulpecula TaxID=9337 RepID=UPI00186B0960|nr:protocadherin gamma-B5-like isoform X7 [Trichosurus vulpecula]